MFFVILGVSIILLNLAGVGPMAVWTWNLTGDLWKFCIPFVFATAWWAYADASGLNKRREMEKMEDRKKQRRADNLQALGMDPRSRKHKHLR